MSDTIPAENQIPSTIETDLIRLAKINNRFDGTGGDKTGVEIIRKAMETCGFQTRTETFSVPGFWSWRLLLVIGIFFLINFLFRYILLFSLFLYLLNMVMLWGELTFSFHAADRLLFRHKSVNVEALISADKKKPKTVIVMAHHDTPRTGNIYPIAGRVVKFGSALPPPFNRALVLLCITAMIILDVGWSRPSAGANDNGSGFLVLMELGRRLALNRSVNADIRLLATGAEESGFFGIKDYLKRHKSELPAETLFINLECVGAEDLHWATGEEHLVKIEYNRKSFDLIDHLEGKELIPAVPKKHIIAPTDAGPVKTEGLDVVTLIGLKNGSIPEYYHQISDTFDKLDRKILTQASDIVEAMIRNV